MGHSLRLVRFSCRWSLQRESKVSHGSRTLNIVVVKRRWQKWPYWGQRDYSTPGTAQARLLAAEVVWCRSTGPRATSHSPVANESSEARRKGLRGQLPPCICYHNITLAIFYWELNTWELLCSHSTPLHTCDKKKKNYPHFAYGETEA